VETFALKFEETGVNITVRLIITGSLFIYAVPALEMVTAFQEMKIVTYYIWNNEEKREFIMSLFSRRNLIKQNYGQLYFVEILHVLLRILL
jgi:hypothetical protein